MEEIFAGDLEAISRIDAIPNILEVVCRTTGLGFAAVARVTEQRWIACSVRDEIEFGLKPGGELQVETTICNEIRDTGKIVAIDHAAEDTIFCDHPTPKKYGFQSYISVPIFLANGQFFGTLCAIDRKPARVNTTETIGMFRLFADLIAFHLDAREQLQLSETALENERHTAELREQFIAVLGHDLRNPLNAISGGARILTQMELGEGAVPVVAMIQRSAARMAGLIDNVMDFARGRMGGGLPLARALDTRVESTLLQIIGEARVVWPERLIQMEFDVNQPVTCDLARMGQLFSNLLANAIIHGDSDAPIRVRAQCDDDVFVLSVTNLGDPIKPEMVGQLFQPFYRASAAPDQQGLGLGLYIASAIAKAHGGTLEVESSAKETCFTFRLPANSTADIPHFNSQSGRREEERSDRFSSSARAEI